MGEPCDTHMEAALHIVKYLKGTSSTGLYYHSAADLKLEAYCDSDWATCPITRRSLTGYCIFLGPNIVSWKTKKQPTVSRSSCEAEYRRMANTVCELQWLSYLLKDFQLQVQTPIPLWCDNKSALHIAANPVYHERTKHIEVDCHVIRDKFKEDFILPQHIPTQLQVADLFTKSLSKPQFQSLMSKLGLVSQQAPS